MAESSADGWRSSEQIRKQAEAWGTWIVHPANPTGEGWTWWPGPGIGRRESQEASPRISRSTEGEHLAKATEQGKGQTRSEGRTETHGTRFEAPAEILTQPPEEAGRAIAEGEWSERRPPGRPHR